MPAVSPATMPGYSPSCHSGRYVKAVSVHRRSGQDGCPHERQTPFAFAPTDAPGHHRSPSNPSSKVPHGLRRYPPGAPSPLPPRLRTGISGYRWALFHWREAPQKHIRSQIPPPCHPMRSGHISSIPAGRDPPLEKELVCRHSAAIRRIIRVEKATIPSPTAPGSPADRHNAHKNPASPSPPARSPLHTRLADTPAVPPSAAAHWLCRPHSSPAVSIPHSYRYAHCPKPHWASTKKRSAPSPSPVAAASSSPALSSAPGFDKKQPAPITSIIKRQIKGLSCAVGVNSK